MLYDWLRHIEFAYPKVFSLFLWIPILLWWYIAKYRSGQPSIKVSTIQSFNTSSWKIVFRHLLFVLRLLALSSLIMALARPQVRNDEQQSRGQGIDIVLSMDVSGSMLSQDFQPNRLEVSKEMAADFIRSRPVDRIGLVIFSGESYTLCPITTDKNTLITQVESLRSGMLLDGTVIGEGLATAVDRLSKSDAKSKVIILLTDGKEEPRETRLIDPLTGLDIAKAHGVKVYTIGIGAQNYTPVAEKVGTSTRTSDAFLDEDLLRRIATETGGQYFRARDRLSLKNIYDQIDKLEKSEIEITTQKKYEEKFIPFILAALIFLFLEILLRFTVFKRFP